MSAVFNIGSQTAGRDIFNIAGDLNIDSKSSAVDVDIILQAISAKLSELEVPEKNKKKAIITAVRYRRAHLPER